MRPQAYRPTPYWISLLGLIAYAIPVAFLVWVALALLGSLDSYSPSLP